MSEKRSLRKEMPLVTAFIDDLRKAFGAENIDPSIQAGMRGEAATFWASENGIEVGTKATGGVSVNGYGEVTEC